MLRTRAMIGGFVVAACLLLVGNEGRPEHGLPAEERSTWVWRKMPEPKGLPLIGNESAAVFDTSVNRLLLFGGHLGNGGPQFFYTWRYDPATNAWEHARPKNRPPGACCVREGVYDQANQLTYYLGGHSYNHGWQWRPPHGRGGGVPWAYDAKANTWRAMKPISSRRGRPWTGAAYDGEHQVVVTYGGEGFYKTDVWVYDGYTNTWTFLKRQGEGPDVGGHCPPMVFDAEHKVVLMYGHGYAKKARDELWAYDLKANAWTPRNDRNRPKRISLPLMVYDPRNRMPIIFIPVARKPLKVFAYHWDDSAWREQPATGEPPPSHVLHVGAYDPIGHQTILGKGLVYSSQQKVGFRRPKATYILQHPRPRKKPTALPAPAGVQIVTDAGGATLTWKPVPGAADYTVYRGTGDVPWKVNYRKAGQAKEPTFTDRGLSRGTVYFYCVRAVGANGREGEASLKVRTQPGVPAEPVVSVLAKDRVEIDWPKSPYADVVGYNLYRGKGTALAKVNEALLVGTTHADRFAVPGGGDVSARYVVKAVNRLGVESGPSPWATTVPREPTGIVARTEGGKAVVTWKPCPQKALQGYNVYRADSGRGDPRKLARKIAGPIQATRFVDASKTDRKACRYYVTAVDAIGQEGYASHGAWLNDPNRS